MTNVIEMPGLDARHPADQPETEEARLKRLIDQHNRAWNRGAEDVQEHDAVKLSQPKETPPSVRTIARQQNVDLRSLLGILELQRPAGSTTEALFVEQVIGEIEGIQEDGYGNHFLTIGENPTVLWSCHTDTVAKDDGRQNIKWDGDILRLNDPKQGQCLGADDGAGIWLLMQMIEAKVPGLYIFHREEEIGGRGSDYIAEKNKGLLEGIKYAIAFDRRDVDSVITHQGGQRTCSAKFAEAMIEKLNTVEGLKYSKDTGGSFTDTKNYIDLIPECTNISCGYYREHGTNESLDVRHLLRLREALITQDWSDLPVDREAGSTEWDDDDFGYGSMYGGWGRTSTQRYGRSLTAVPKTPFDALHDMVKERAYSVAKMLEKMGMTPSMLDEAIYNLWQKDVNDQRSAKREADEETVADYLRRTGAADAEDDEPLIEERMWCDDCGEWCDERYVFDEGCPQCFGNNTEWIEVEVDSVSGEVLTNA
jgi:acetylornithine deacetylase/succinyl-diaminopimelate desuccinylase-like protein